MKDKEKLKLNIQNIFTKIRNELNNREDELLLEDDRQYNGIFFDEKKLKESERLPNEVKYYLEICKKLNFSDDKLPLNINECINAENRIKDINKDNRIIKTCQNDIELEIEFNYEN